MELELIDVLQDPYDCSKVDRRAGAGLRRIPHSITNVAVLLHS